MKSKGQEHMLNALSAEIKAHKTMDKMGYYADPRKLYDAKLKRKQYAAWCCKPGKSANRFKKQYRDRQNPFRFLLTGGR